MPPDPDNDFHVKEIMDMINVIQRMIKDGKSKIDMFVWKITLNVIHSCELKKNKKEREITSIKFHPIDEIP